MIQLKEFDGYLVGIWVETNFNILQIFTRAANGIPGSMVASEDWGFGGWAHFLTAHAAEMGIMYSL